MTNNDRALPHFPAPRPADETSPYRMTVTTDVRMPLHAGVGEARGPVTTVRRNVAARRTKAPDLRANANRAARDSEAARKGDARPDAAASDHQTALDVAALEAVSRARTEQRRDLYRRFSRPLLGFGFPAVGRGLIVAYPHRVGYGSLVFAALTIVAHSAGGRVGRPTTAFVAGFGLVAADRISLERPWSRLLAYVFVMTVAIFSDACTRELLFPGWD